MVEQLRKIMKEIKNLMKEKAVSAYANANGSSIIDKLNYYKSKVHERDARNKQFNSKELNVTHTQSKSLERT